MTIDPYLNQSFLSEHVLPQNFSPVKSAKLAVSGTSSSVTFTGLTGTLRTTFKISNKGTSGAYIAWGSGSATAVASSSSPAVNCDYVGAGAILTQDFQIAGLIVDTLAAIQDTGATTLEISIGYGQ